MRTFIVYRDREIGWIREILKEDKNVTWHCSFCQDSFAWGSSERGTAFPYGPFSTVGPERVKDIVFDRAPYQVVLSDGNPYDFCGSWECLRFKALLVALEVQNQVFVKAIQKIAEKLS